MKKFFSMFIPAFFAVTILFASTSYADWTVPATDDDADVWAVQDANADDVGLTANPEYGFTGAIPQDAVVTVTLGGGAKFADAIINDNIMFFDDSLGTTDLELTGAAPEAGDTSFTLLVTGGSVSDGDTLQITGEVEEVDKIAKIAEAHLALDLSGCSEGTDVTISIEASSYLPSTSRDIVDPVDIAEVVNTDPSDTTLIDVSAAKKELVDDDGTTLESDDAEYDVQINKVDIGPEGIAEGKLLFTITGDMSAVDHIEGTGGVRGCDSDGDQIDGTENEFLIDAENNVAYASNTNPLVGGGERKADADNGVDVDIIVTFDGETAIPEGSYTIQATVLNNDFDEFDFDEFVFLTLEYNGTTRSIYNIPASDNSDQAYIRIYNTSTIDGTVYGTLCDQDGNVVGTASTVLVSDMAAGATQVFSAADLEDLFGDTWTGRARMTIDSETPSMEVQALIRSATGTITNMSSMAMDD